MQQALERAKAILGGPGAMAKAIGDLTPQAVSQWKRVPPERVLSVESLTGVSRHELRPDIYGVASPVADVPNDGASTAVQAGEAVTPPALSPADFGSASCAAEQNPEAA